MKTDFDTLYTELHEDKQAFLIRFLPDGKRVVITYDVEYTFDRRGNVERVSAR